MNIIRTKESDLKELYDGSAFTMEGFNIDDDNLEALKNWFEEHECTLKSDDVYVTSGKLMNEVYGLTGDNAYPEEVNIVSIKLDDISNVNRIFIARFEIGARWFDDIVDNNARREK